MPDTMKCRICKKKAPWEALGLCKNCWEIDSRLSLGLTKSALAYFYLKLYRIASAAGYEL